MEKDTLGVDVGGVIIDRRGGEIDKVTRSIPRVRGAFEVLHQLVANRFGERVHLVSKCNTQTQADVADWLKFSHFYQATGILPENVHFCLERHEKAGICQDLGITHFVDDRLEVLSYLTTVKTLFLFQPRLEEVRRFGDFVGQVRLASCWQEIVDCLLPGSG